MSRSEDTPPEESDGCSRGSFSLPEKHILLPSELHSVYEKGPFKSCSVCSECLLNGKPYEIQKVYKAREVIFEMAVCQSCAEAAASEFSEESMEALKGFLLSNFKPSLETEHCHFCGFPRKLTSGYTLAAACRMNGLLAPSLVLCERCSENLHSRLSKKTKDAQEDFVRNNFPGVPADLDLNPTLGGII